MAFTEPGTVVALLERVKREAQVPDGVEGLHPQPLFLQRADEPLGDAVALWLADERRARRDPQEPQLVLEVVTDVITRV